MNDSLEDITTSFLEKKENLCPVNQGRQHLPQLVFSFGAEKVTRQTHAKSTSCCHLHHMWADLVAGERAGTDFARSGRHSWWATPTMRQTLRPRQRTFWVTPRAGWCQSSSRRQKILEKFYFDLVYLFLTMAVIWYGKQTEWLTKVKGKERRRACFLTFPLLSPCGAADADRPLQTWYPPPVLVMHMSGPVSAPGLAPSTTFCSKIPTIQTQTGM